MADDALAYLTEAFGHCSEAEMKAFLDATPRAAETCFAVSGIPPVTPELAVADFARRETPSAPRVSRLQAARA
ncbi:MAG: hypothetical protein PGN25_10710 [Methylorubrum populi]